LKALVGRWEVRTSEGASALVAYELVSGGSALFEQYIEDKSPEPAMVSAFHLDALGS
jgi:hypothetical protein